MGAASETACNLAEQPRITGAGMTDDERTEREVG